MKPPAESKLWLQTHLGSGAACEWQGTRGRHPPDKRRSPLAPTSPSTPTPRANESAMTQGRGQAARGPAAAPVPAHAALPAALHRHPRAPAAGSRRWAAEQTPPAISSPRLHHPFPTAEDAATEPTALPLGVAPESPAHSALEKLVSSSHFCHAQQRFPLLPQAEGATAPAPPALTPRPQKNRY